jgi:hypothetical protein
VNQFVQDCRSEWKRLGVPDPVADEMAAELAADLAEAEAEGASARDVLGTGAVDARKFAHAWAVQRGVGQPPATARHSRGRRILVAAAAATFALLAIAGAAFLILDSPSAPARVAIASPLDPGETGMVWVRGPVVSPDGRMIVAPPPDTRVVVAPPPVERLRVFSVDDDPGSNARILGSILLSVGLTGLVLLLFLAVASPRSVLAAPRG